jgi:hypothetical protein
MELIKQCHHFFSSNKQKRIAAKRHYPTIKLDAVYTTVDSEK